MQKKRLLITGAAGFIGRWVVDVALKRGWHVTGLGPTTPVDMPHVDWIPYALQPSLPALPDLSMFTACIHLAWPLPKHSYFDAATNFDALTASVHFIHHMLQCGCARFVIAGSCAEYAAEHNSQLSETTEVKPNTVYGQCKNALREIAETLIPAHHASMAWARIFQVYGPGEAEKRLLPSLASTWKAGNIFYGASGLQWRDYLHVNDVAEALVLLAESDVSGKFNVCSGSRIQIAGLINKFAEHFNAHSLVQLGKKAERQAWEPEMIWGNNSKLKALGWQQQIPLDDGLREYARYLYTPTVSYTTRHSYYALPAQRT